MTMTAKDSVDAQMPLPDKNQNFKLKYKKFTKEIVCIGRQTRQQQGDPSRKKGRKI